MTLRKPSKSSQPWSGARGNSYIDARSFSEKAPVGVQTKITAEIKTSDGQKWTKDITVSISAPKDYKLYDNFPNPFPEQDVREADHHTMCLWIGSIRQRRSHLSFRKHRREADDLRHSWSVDCAGCGWGLSRRLYRADMERHKQKREPCLIGGLLLPCKR